MVTSLARGHSAVSCAKIERVLEVKFVDSLSSNHIQVVDIIAYVINRHMRGDEDFKEMYSKLERKIWRGGKWRGLRVI